MKFVSSQEVIDFHDRLISRDGGVAGMPEPRQPGGCKSWCGRI
ncbi:hypothetical protein ACRWAW_003637 [Escherichia coli]